MVGLCCEEASGLDRAVLYRCLIVEDDDPWRETLAALLQQCGFDVMTAATASAAMDMMGRGPHVVLLDLWLPDAPGLQLLLQMRAQFPNIPVVVVSGDERVSMKVEAFERGAADYIIKAASVDEVSARIRAVAKRSAGTRSSALDAASDLLLDPEECTVRARGVRVRLSRKEFALLNVFASSPGKLLRQEYLLDALWGPHTDPQLLRVFVAALRRKIEIDPEHPRYIVTVRGLGYRFQPMPDAVP